MSTQTPDKGIDATLISAGRWGRLFVMPDRRLCAVAPSGYVGLLPTRQASGYIVWDDPQRMSKELKRRTLAEFNRMAATGQHYQNDYCGRCDWPGLQATEPRDWSPEQREAAIAFYVTQPLKELRKRQTICHSQLGQLHRIGNQSIRDDAAGNLQMINELLRVAVDRQQFPAGKR